ncbi:MAG: hypothetical protein FWC56_05115 [Phycisphaerae bacterium]|nr:hypothetical protein [Phycisphaerae bacterium]
MMIPRLSTLDEATRQVRLLNERLLKQDRWTLVPKDAYQEQPSADQQYIIGPSPSWIPMWTPIRYANNTDTRYGIAIGRSTTVGRVRVAGPPLVGPIRALWIGKPELVVQMDLNVSGNWEATVQNNIYRTWMNATQCWLRPPARLVYYRAWKTTDSPPTMVNVTIDGKRTYTGNSGLGLLVNSGWSGTQNLMNPETCRIEEIQLIDFDVTQVGAVSTTSPLSLNMAFVLE